MNSFFFVSVISLVLVFTVTVALLSDLPVKMYRLVKERVKRRVRKAEDDLGIGD